MTKTKKIDSLFVPHGDIEWPSDREFVVMTRGGYMMFKTEEDMDKWLAARPKAILDDEDEDEEETWDNELPRAGKIGFRPPKKMKK